jgi:ipoprotein LpqH
VVHRHARKGTAIVALAVAAVGTGLSGWSNNASSALAVSLADVPRLAPQVFVDGQPQNATGGVTCNTAGNTVTIGIGDASNGFGAVLSTDNPPVVHTVGLGIVDGVALGFSDSPLGQAGQATAVVNGNSYTIKGTATGSDTSNPQAPQQVSMSFEMDVTCP